MYPDVAAPIAGRRVLQREAAQWWWVPLAGALIWFLIAWLVLRANYASLATVGVLVGVAFVIAALNEAALAALMRGGWAALHIVLAVVFVLGAIWAFVRPINTFFALASVLGLLLFLQGMLTITRGVALRDETPYWWLEVVGGGLLTLLAIWVSTSDRVWSLGSRAVFILLWVGFMAIFRGLSDIALAFALRRFAHEKERLLGTQRATEAVPPSIPPQFQEASVPHATGARDRPTS